LSSDPTHAEILLRKATRLAAQMSTRCYAVYIQKKTESATNIDSALQRKLQNNMKLANQLGAEIVTVPAENISDALVTFATKNHVKHAVFGKSRRSPIMDLFKGSVILDFIHDSVGIDVHIVTTTGDDGDVPSTPHT
jgi:two-component system sensor histidine kinase KdpD